MSQLPLFVPLLDREMPSIAVGEVEPRDMPRPPSNVIVLKRDTVLPVMPTPDAKRAAKLEALADGLQKTIDHKFADRLENTGRRARMAESQRSEGRALQRIQSVLRNLADLHRKGACPPLLAGISNKAQVGFFTGKCGNFDRPGTCEHGRPRWTSADSERCWKSDAWKCEREMMKRLGIKAPKDLDAVLQQIGQLVSEEAPEQKKAREIKRLENELIGCKIPGFFPTPPEVIEIMKQEWPRNPALRVFEPSAGNGAIADELRIMYSDMAVCEVNHALRRILELKGHNLIGHNCMEMTDRFDLIVMNPPFEHGQDCRHVQYLFNTCLKPGGRLIAIMSPAFTFRKEELYETFRTWLATVSRSVTDLPEGSFAKADIRRTGVSTKLLIIEK